MSSEDWNSLSAFFDGSLTPRPPCRAGKANRANSWSFGGGLLVSAGKSSVLRASSSGVSWWLMFGVTLHR